MTGLNPYPLLVLTGLLGLSAIGAVLLVRALDQQARDHRRVVVLVSFPRGLTAGQVVAAVRVLTGASQTRRFTGRDSVVLEVLGESHGVTHRLRLPEHSSAYLMAQLRAIVPGLHLEKIRREAGAPFRRALDLQRRLTEADLAAKDPATVSRTILSAQAGGHHHQDVSIWQVVISGGITSRPAATGSVWQRLTQGQSKTAPRSDDGVIGVALRLGATADTDRHARELVARLLRAAGSISAPNARLLPRLLPSAVVGKRVARAATPILAAPVFLRPEELAALLGWPIESPLVPGLSLGGSPQLPAAHSVPRYGRVLGQSTAEDRAVAQPVKGATEHTLIVGPTGSGKSWLSANLFLGDVEAGRGGILVDPTGQIARAVIKRLPASAIGRTVVVDPMDVERPVPLPLLAGEAGGIPELAADTLVGLLRHRYRDLGPRSSDILSASLYALARVPNATLMDLLPLWSDARFRASVAAQVSDDPVLAGFFAWFDGLGIAERNFILAAPLNKIRPLLQRPVVRNVLAAPRVSFTFGEALRQRLVVIVALPEGVLGGEATALIGQVVLARIWSAVQARSNRAFFNLTIDEAPRFLDQPTDLGDVLARARQYGVGTTLITQSLAQFSPTLRDVALTNARTKLAFGTTSSDARRLADELGPGVQAEFFAGLSRYEAIGAVSLGATVSPAFTFRSEELGRPIAGREAAVREASRERWGIDRGEIEQSFVRHRGDGDANGPVGRRKK
jgi:hypothetical protein